MFYSFSFNKNFHLYYFPVAKLAVFPSSFAHFELCARAKRKCLIFQNIRLFVPSILATWMLKAKEGCAFFSFVGKPGSQYIKIALTFGRRAPNVSQPFGIWSVKGWLIFVCTLCCCCCCCLAGLNLKWFFSIEVNGKVIYYSITTNSNCGFQFIIATASEFNSNENLKTALRIVNVA